MASNEENDLLTKLKAGNCEAFEAIYDLYWERLYKSAYNILNNEEIVMDILQEVFVNLWERRELLEISSLTAYLYAAIKYKTANSIRNGKTRQTFLDKIEALDYFEQPTYDIIELKELKKLIYNIIDQLPEKTKEVFLLSRHEQLSNKEIAGKLDISVKAVEYHITLALKYLKKKMGTLYFLFFLF